MGQVKREETPTIFDCGKCGISWDSKEEYEQHCKDDPMNHTQEGQAPCIYCGKICYFKTMVFTKEGEPTPAVCETCLNLVVKPALQSAGLIPNTAEPTVVKEVKQK